MKTMKAVLAAKQGAVVSDVPVPHAGPGQLLVQVHNAALNRADLGASRLGNDEIIGMEWSGVVVDTGPDAGRFQVGDRVMCSGRHAFAEYAVAEAARTIPMPPQLEYRKAASLMLALQTMHDAVVTHGRVKEGDAVLIHGAASNVGLMAAQIARTFGARTVIGTSRDPGRRRALESHGIDLVLDSTGPSWTEKVMEHTGDRGVDVIIDQVSGKGFNDLLRVAAIMGRIVNVGRLGGANGDFDFEMHAFKRLTYTGVTFRTRSLDEIGRLTSAMFDDLGPALRRGELTMPLDQEFALDRAQEALDRMAANQHFGKITLRVA